MLTAVIGFNIALAILCLIAVWKLRQAKRALRRATRWLTNAEQNTEQVLFQAPYYMLLGQSVVVQSHRQVAGFGILQRQVIRFVALLKLMQWIQQRQTWPMKGRLASRTKRRS